MYATRYAHAHAHRLERLYTMLNRKRESGLSVGNVVLPASCIRGVGASRNNPLLAEDLGPSGGMVSWVSPHVINASKAVIETGYRDVDVDVVHCSRQTN